LFLTTFKKADENALAAINEEMSIRGTKEVFLLFSMGSQFDHLIKQKLDQLGVFCLVADPGSVRAEDVKMLKPIGIILSGGPVSVYEDSVPFDKEIFDIGIPILGICLGFQMWARHIGEEVKASHKREFGVHQFEAIHKHCSLLEGIPARSPVLQNHGDIIDDQTGLIYSLGFTENSPTAAGYYRHLWGVQFHPEVEETKYGLEIFGNFCFKICKANDRFPAEKAAEIKINALAKKIGKNKKVLMALSGGSDSSTAIYLLREAKEQSANPNKIEALYIKGIDRPDDEAYVIKFFSHEPWLNLKIIDATDEFLKVLAGKITMKDKRIAMRSVYKEVIEKYAVKVGADYIAQGTLYTDISESGSGYSSQAVKAQIKLHHNVNLEFFLPELCPLDDCVKDTGRNIGRQIGVPEELLIKHPFPGPGLVVRIEGEINADNLIIARQIDGIYIEELRKENLYHSVWQAGAVVTRSIVTCGKSDGAVEGIVVALWAVWSTNGFTASAAELPFDFIKHVSRRITNEVREVGTVVYRCSDKPPTTIEWG